MLQAFEALVQRDARLSVGEVAYVTAGQISEGKLGKPPAETPISVVGRRS